MEFAKLSNATTASAVPKVRNKNKNKNSRRQTNLQNHRLQCLPVKKDLKAAHHKRFRRRSNQTA